MTHTVPEVAERYAVGKRTVLGWIRDGDLKAVICSQNINSQKPRYRISDKHLAEFELLRSTAPPEQTRRRKRKQSSDVTEYYK